MSLIQLAPAPRAAANPSGSSPLSRPDAKPPRLRRPELVDRVTTLVRDNLGEPLTIAELSRVAGVSERTLRAAFREALGLSPKQYTLGQRLRAAHDALLAAEPGRTTVTDVAMTYGFFELGRFAGRYRLAFGEPPSATLRHAVAMRSDQAA